MRATAFVVAVVATLACLVLAAPIVSLPGLSFTPSFKQYSGYITPAGTTRNLFYWILESKLADPSTAPVLIWLQGGPGASSLLGLFTEWGPYAFGDDGSVNEAPYAWNDHVTMVAIESPCGVGFSYDESGNYTTGDNQTSADLLSFLLQFYEQYPQYATNPLWISGESYGGHYVPQFSQRIVQYNKANPAAPLPWVGMLVGNPWTDDKLDSEAVPLFVYTHALCAKSTYDKVVEHCHIPPKTHDPRDFIHPLHRLATDPQVSDKCNEAVGKMFNETGSDINQYDIYTNCTAGVGLDCMNYTLLMNYLNDPTVQKAINANPANWAPINNIDYVESWSSVTSIYPELMAAGRVLVYSGDVTYNCPTLGSNNWIDKMGFEEVQQWTAYLLDGQVAGYTKHYVNFTFATVKNAGHMVPQYQPASAYHMLKLWLAGEL